MSVLTTLTKFVQPLIYAFRMTPVVSLTDDGKVIIQSETIYDQIAKKFLAVLAGCMGVIALAVPLVNREQAESIADEYFRMMTTLWYGGALDEQ